MSTDMPICDDLLANISTIPHTLRTKAKEKAGHMLPFTKQILSDFFQKHNRDLADLLDDDRFLWSEHTTDDDIERYRNIYSDS
jgi:hypothetical protein